MKTKELIRLLNEQDPSGEEECCINNLDIMYIQKEPAYYDGSLQVFERDESHKILKNKKAKYVRKGSKIQITTESISDFLFDFPEMEIDYSELSEYSKQLKIQQNNRVVEFAKRIDDELFAENFVEWCLRKAKALDADLLEFKNTAKEFAVENLKIENFKDVDKSKSIHDNQIEMFEKLYKIELNEDGFGVDIKFLNSFSDPSDNRNSH
jgi:hypothetical protein